MAGLELNFQHDVKLLGAGSAKGLLIHESTAQDVLTALLADTPFPQRTLEIASGSVGAQGGKDIVFGRGRAAVSFGAELAGRVLVTGDRARMLASLPVADAIADGLGLDGAGDADPAARYLVLAWSYDLKGAAHGAMGLGAGASVQFGVDARKAGGYAVVRRFAPATGARTVLQGAVDAWRLPSQVKSVDDLTPGTWLVAEIDGALALQLGVQAGWDFTWLRQSELGALAGDVSLRLQAALSASLGLEASGRYALLLRRDALDPAARKVRLQLFKQRKKGWSFALNAGASVQADLGNLPPASLDELLRAVFGLHATQLLDDLESIGSASDAAGGLGNLLAGAGVERSKALLARVTGIDVEARLEEARQRLSTALESFQQLDHRVASVVWAHLEKAPALAAIRTLASEVQATLGDEDAIRRLLAGRLGAGGFAGSPEGAWLQAAAGDQVVRLVGSSSAVQALLAAADRTLEVLDEGTVERLLGKLRGEIERVFGLDAVEGAIERAIAASDPAELDAWLRQRLAKFLDAQPTVAALEGILNTVRAWQERGENLYARTLQALQRQYQAAFAATYQRTTSSAALLDVELDFASGGDALGKLLEDAIDGRFDRLLVESLPGVTLHQASLSHQIDRRRHIELSLPSRFFQSTDVASSLARVSAQEDDGRLLLYEGTAGDEVAVATAKARRDSQLSVVTRFPQPAGVRLRHPGSLSFSYSFHQALAQTRASQLTTQLAPYVARFFPGSFPTDGDGETSGSFANWVASLDQAVETLENNGLGNLGNTLLSLQIGLAGEIGGAWLEAPPAGDEAYVRMSRALQARLKELVALVYFQDPERLWPRLVPSACLFAYAALPPLVDVRLQAGELVAAGRGDLHWNFQDTDLLRAALLSLDATRALDAAARQAHDLLLSLPGHGQQAADFANLNNFANFIRTFAFASSQSPQPQLLSLLDSERRIVQGAARAGALMAEARAAATGDQPERAVAALAAFGEALTSAFNRDVRNVYLKGSLRPFGTLLFAEAASAFDPLLETRTSALLELAVLAAGAPFPPAGFPDVSQVPAADILIQENLVSL